MLLRLDILRGFSGAEKLAFSQEVRQHVVDADDFSLETTIGCPADLFLQIGAVLEAGKSYIGKDIDLIEFKDICEEAEDFLRSWDLDQDIYPNSAPEWRLLADAYPTCLHTTSVEISRCVSNILQRLTNPRICARYTRSLCTSSLVLTILQTCPFPLVHGRRRDQFAP